MLREDDMPKGLLSYPPKGWTVMREKLFHWYVVNPEGQLMEGPRDFRHQAIRHAWDLVIDLVHGDVKATPEIQNPSDRWLRS